MLFQSSRVHILMYIRCRSYFVTNFLSVLFRPNYSFDPFISQLFVDPMSSQLFFRSYVVPTILSILCRPNYSFILFRPNYSFEPMSSQLFFRSYVVPTIFSILCHPCLVFTSPRPLDLTNPRMPSSS